MFVPNPPLALDPSEHSSDYFSDVLVCGVTTCAHGLSHVCGTTNDLGGLRVLLVFCSDGSARRGSAESDSEPEATAGRFHVCMSRAAGRYSRSAPSWLQFQEYIAREARFSRVRVPRAWPHDCGRGRIHEMTEGGGQGVTSRNGGRRPSANTTTRAAVYRTVSLQ